MRLLIPPPIYALVIVLLIWGVSNWFPALALDFPGKTFVAGIMIFVGLGFDLISVRRFFTANTTVSPLTPKKAEALVTDGLYRYSRNPMYLGLALILTGIAVWAGNWLGFLGVPLFVVLITQFQIKPEEEILLEKFGEPYGDYKMQVRRWI